MMYCVFYVYAQLHMCCFVSGGRLGAGRLWWDVVDVSFE